MVIGRVRHNPTSTRARGNLEEGRFLCLAWWALTKGKRAISRLGYHTILSQKGSRKGSVLFHGPPKYAAELLVDIFRECRSGKGATPWRHPSSRNALSGHYYLDGREMGKTLATSRFFFLIVEASVIMVTGTVTTIVCLHLFVPRKNVPSLRQCWTNR